LPRRRQLFVRILENGKPLGYNAPLARGHLAPFRQERPGS
jgi:hypothetical protein